MVWIQGTEIRNNFKKVIMPNHSQVQAQIHHKVLVLIKKILTQFQWLKISKIKLKKSLCLWKMLLKTNFITKTLYYSLKGKKETSNSKLEDQIMTIKNKKLTLVFWILEDYKIVSPCFIKMRKVMRDKYQ